MGKTHYRGWQMKPEWTPCGIHKRGKKYEWSTDWDEVDCNACRRWARQLSDSVAIANGGQPLGNAGYPQPVSKQK